MKVSGSKAKDKRPARAKYWAGEHLKKNKVKRIMRSAKITRLEATDIWEKSRGGRRMKVR